MVITEELNQDIIKAFNQLKNHNSYRYRIYPWSNEHIEKYYNYYDLQGKKVLCPIGSGDHTLYAITGGASKIDCVDINPLAKYYQALKLALINKYNESDFWKHYSNECFQTLSTKINLNDIKDFLDDDSFIFWEQLINHPGFEQNKYLFRFDGEPFPIISEYKNIKDNINNTEITFYDDDISFFIKDIDIKYDAIFLSNILEWQRSSKRQSIIEDCFEILEPNGVIYDVICRRNFENAEEFKYLEKKIPTKFYENSTSVEKGVYVYRKK